MTGKVPKVLVSLRRPPHLVRVRARVLTTVHLSVQNSEGLERVVIGGLENGHFLSQRERFILFPGALKADRLQDLKDEKEQKE